MQRTDLSVCVCKSVLDVVIKQQTHFTIPIAGLRKRWSADFRLIFFCDQKSKIDESKKRLRVPLGDYVIECCQKKATPFLFIYSCDVCAYVRACACMCMRSKSKSMLQLSFLLSRFTFHLRCNEKRFLFSHWVIGTAKPMWIQNCTVSHGNNIQELDTIDRQRQCNYKNRLHVLSVKSKTISRMCVCVCVHLRSACCCGCVFPFGACVFAGTLLLQMLFLLLLQIFYGSFSCVHEKADMKLCNHDKIHVFFVRSLHSLAAIAFSWPYLFVYLCEWPCVIVCLCVWAFTFWFVALSFLMSFSLAPSLSLFLQIIS